MALISCPECGKEKVSESAKVCPECGYDIFVYKRDEVSKERIKELVEIHKKNIEERLLTIEMPEYPKHSLYEYIFIVAGMIGVIILYQIFSFKGAVFGIVLLTTLIYYITKLYDDKLSEYILAIRDFESYRERELNRQLWGQADMHMQCPICKSTNISKVPIGSQIMTTTMLKKNFLKWGRQYKCYSCKNIW